MLIQSIEFFVTLIIYREVTSFVFRYRSKFIVVIVDSHDGYIQNVFFEGPSDHPIQVKTVGLLNNT